MSTSWRSGANIVRRTTPRSGVMATVWFTGTTREDHGPTGQTRQTAVVTTTRIATIGVGTGHHHHHHRHHHPDGTIGTGDDNIAAEVRAKTAPMSLGMITTTAERGIVIESVTPQGGDRRGVGQRKETGQRTKTNDTHDPYRYLATVRCMCASNVSSFRCPCSAESCQASSNLRQTTRKGMHIHMHIHIHIHMYRRIYTCERLSNAACYSNLAKLLALRIDQCASQCMRNSDCLEHRLVCTRCPPRGVRVTG